MPRPCSSRTSRNPSVVDSESHSSRASSPCTTSKPVKKTTKRPVKKQAKKPVTKPAKKPVKKPTKKSIRKVSGSKKFATAKCSSESEDFGMEQLSGGTKAVMKMVEYLDSGKNYKIFFDNWFSSVSLAYRLLAIGIHSTATIQIRRVKGIEFQTPLKKFTKMNRGYYEELFSNDGRMCIVRWLDNKPVNLLSTYLEAAPLLKVNRWSKSSQTRVDVQCPNVVGEYNKHMGGVDLADMLLALYRIDRRSKKYYNRIIFYLFGVCTVNAWIMYKLNHPTNKCALLEFTLNLSFSLMRAGKHATSIPPAVQYNRKKTAIDIRFDGIDHMPVIKDRQRCKIESCQLKTFISCVKCNVYLCIVPGKVNRNCFVDYHNQ